LSKTEVAFTAMEQLHRATTAEEEARIDKIWSANLGLKIVEYNDLVALIARDIRRDDMNRGWSGYRAPDIIHLATARFMQVDEMHTLDVGLHRYSNVLGFPVTNPLSPQ
ncbi:MAG TPA: hypothetical protein VHV31_04165, partial [Nitrolancea sp.]|nr:hypothetical protein [Nitrolancea sp.]